MKKSIIIFSIIFFAAGLGARASATQNPTEIDTFELLGSVGNSVIGANIVAAGYDRFLGGHYFYAKYGINIPLTGSISNGRMHLVGQDGSTMDLQFVTLPQEQYSGFLTFWTSTGLNGVWTKGPERLPVSLVLQTTYPGVRQPRYWYGSISNESEEVFEENARRFLDGAIKGNKEEAASASSFPLHHWHHVISSKEELYQQWNMIFTPEYIEILKTVVPHEMPIINGEAMGAHGAIWFNGRGCVDIQTP